MPPLPCCRYAFDWDNVFWSLNLLMAQETGKNTFRKQTELFLKNWICANNAANYTMRGRAFNPFSGSLGATANAAMVALMYADTVADTEPASAKVYRCWGLSQVRYMLGDSGQSLVVGTGKNPPKRTQDRAAACPAKPQVCNRVTGLLSPDPDTYSLDGALVYGSGFNDDFIDVRSGDSNRVGVENNAGLAGGSGCRGPCSLLPRAAKPPGIWISRRGGPRSMRLGCSPVRPCCHSCRRAGRLGDAAGRHVGGLPAGVWGLPLQPCLRLFHQHLDVAACCVRGPGWSPGARRPAATIPTQNEGY